MTPLNNQTRLDFRQLAASPGRPSSAPAVLHGHRRKLFRGGRVIQVAQQIINSIALAGLTDHDDNAGAYPNDGDIYLEAVYRVDAAGNFGDPVRNTLGVLLRKDQYTYIEVFAVPKVEVQSDGKERPE